jgi:hypothetical protein
LGGDKRASNVVGMCGRARLSTDLLGHKDQAEVDPDYPAPNIPASWNVCPTDPMLVANAHGVASLVKKAMRVHVMEWVKG